MKYIYSSIVFFLVTGLVESANLSHNIKFMSSKIIVSPATTANVASIIIENESATKVIGKIHDNKGTFYKYLSIDTMKSISWEIPKELRKLNSIYFTPLSPPFQTLELSIGKNIYEIPPRY